MTPTTYAILVRNMRRGHAEALALASRPLPTICTPANPGEAHGDPSTLTLAHTLGAIHGKEAIPAVEIRIGHRESGVRGQTGSVGEEPECPGL